MLINLSIFLLPFVSNMYYWFLDDGRLGTRGGTSSARRKRMEKFNKDSSAAGGSKALDLNYDHLYTIIEVEDLKYLLEVIKCAPFL